jgi:hypothetical protein
MLVSGDIIYIITYTSSFNGNEIYYCFTNEREAIACYENSNLIGETPHIYSANVNRLKIKTTKSLEDYHEN